MNKAAALQIVGLRKTYSEGWRRKQEVLRDLSLNVSKGEVYGLLGRNGAGKSTTLHLLMGLSHPDGGKIRLLGGKPGQRDVLLRVGFCPENPQFPPNLKIVEVMRFHSALVKQRILTPRNRIDWLLGQFELEEYRQRQVRTLSRGSQQKLALALALLARPEILVLDEPLTALDPLARHRVTAILKDLKHSGTAMIISSHILSELECISDRLGVLKEGVIQKEIKVKDRESELGQSMDILVPLQFAKEIQADDADLVGLPEGESTRFAGLPFDRAQKLVKRWSAADIPILEVKHGQTELEQDVLNGLMEAPTTAAESIPVEEKV